MLPFIHLFASRFRSDAKMGCPLQQRLHPSISFLDFRLPRAVLRVGTGPLAKLRAQGLFDKPSHGFAMVGRG
jgi:hypothetical protein